MQTITKEFNIALGHRLENHKGLCNNVHGHNYKLIVEVNKPTRGLIIDDDSSFGMVTDFKDLKQIVESVIEEPMDHAFVYNEKDKDSVAIAEFMKKQIGQKLCPLPFRTTAENMSKWMCEELNDYFKTAGVDLECISITLYETPTSPAIYRWSSIMEK